MRSLVIATVLWLAACGSTGDETNSADTSAVTAVTPAVDTTIKTDTVKVAGDTAKTTF